MKTIDLKGLDISCYTAKLDNGLDIYLLPYKNKKNYFISYATRFGSDVLEFTDEDDVDRKPPLGIAHFLEHKMFEQEDGVDPFTYFSNSGTDSNASTSFDNTQYICYGTKNFSDNLRFLLSFVNNPYYTNDNVNKEKGIIAEEINMYNDIPDFKLEMKLRECLYKTHPRRIDIAGTVEEINKITKEDLYACYKNFYVPNNMFVLVVGNFDKEEALNIITEEVEHRNKKKLPKIKKVQEQIQVNKKEFTIKEQTEVPKLAYGLKISTKRIKLDSFELDLYLNMLTTILFGASSPFREKCRQEKLLNSLDIEWESVDNFRTFYLMANTINPDDLEKALKEEIKNINLDKSTFQRIKKVWIANEVKMIDNINATVNNIYNNILIYNKIIPNRIDTIKKMKLDTLKELIKDIDFNNNSIVKMIN